MSEDKLLPEVKLETEEVQEEETALLRKTFRRESHSNISTDSDEMYSEDFQERDGGTGFSNGSTPSEVNGDHHVIYEVCPTDEIEAVTKKSSAQNGTTINKQRDQIPSPVAYPRFSNGANEEQSSQYTSVSNEIMENERVEFRTENGNEVADLYLERIYEKPSSHNFYCPHCQACITKVIIRDREWVNDATSAPVQAPVDKFRCTSCFSFLIPIGRLFFPDLASTGEKVSSERGNNIENIGIRGREILPVSQETSHYQEAQETTAQVPDQSNVYAVKNKVDHAATLAHPSFGAAITEGRIIQAKTVEAGAEGTDQTQKSACAIPKSTQTHPSIYAAISEDGVVLDKSVNGNKGMDAENIISNGSVKGKDSQIASINKSQVLYQPDGLAISVESETETKATSIPGLSSLETITKTKVNSIPGSSLEAVTDATMIDRALDEKKGIDFKSEVIGIPCPSQEQKGGLLDRFSLSAWIKKAPIPNQLAEVSKSEITQSQIPKPVVTGVPDSPPDHPSLGEVTAASVLGVAVNNDEGPVAISIDDSLEERVDLEPTGVKGLEILKSMVYGGLTELITSLGIVTSAASADAATGNIVALALANLISGLFIIGHNLAILKSQRFRRASSETDSLRVDRYEDALGKRENYILHFTIAFLSFIVFGLVPPLVYGFSFTKSNDRDLKVAAVAGASLVCIIVLAIGKAHTQRPSKWNVYFKTVVYYAVIGGGAAGLSFLAGDLIKKLIKKYEWFEPTPPLNLPLVQMSLPKPAWGSY